MRALLEDKRGSLRRFAVEDLLLGNEVYLRRWLLLHLVTELARCQDLLLLHQAVWNALRSELEGVLSDWSHEAEALVLVATGHRWTSSPSLLVEYSSCCLLWVLYHLWRLLDDVALGVHLWLLRWRLLLKVLLL